MSWRDDVLLQALRRPQVMRELDAPTWATLIRRTRRYALLGKLAAGAEEAGLVGSLPPAVERQFASMLRLSGYNTRETLSESYRLLRALQPLDAPVVLLKGAAYCALGLDVTRGRVSSDIDLMIPRPALEAAEELLKNAGWEAMKTSDYDQSYYRRWMHELPPLRHKRRATVVDLHHTILPLTGRVQPDAAALIASSRRVEVHGLQAQVFSPPDLLIHAAVHMVQDGDLDRRLRDLLDIAALAAQPAQDPGFSEELWKRAARHGAVRPLFHALQLASSMLEKPAAAALLGSADIRSAPGAVARVSISALAPWALLPDPERGRWRASFARFVFYLRSHWLRMPPGLLARHLLTKAMMGWRERWLTLRERQRQGASPG